MDFYTCPLPALARFKETVAAPPDLMGQLAAGLTMRQVVPIIIHQHKLLESLGVQKAVCHFGQPLHKKASTKLSFHTA